ncbi:oligoribonuclease, mitochondrial [Anopheles cruzii]|uniref:oligoribonuclease, mitochondrial n=1 Tax=Anopheles cruzii TaxID=68878 RepID=UPI0022EC8E73|nr:oligoribonuclease, mitochondrial [Anopheles cruzii]
MSTMSPENLVWMDLEMTGLDITRDRILEIACIITDNDLNVVAKGPNFVLHQPESVLEKMNDWCKTMHKQTGLIDAVKASSITLEYAEAETLDFVKKYCPEKRCPLAGNSIYMDRLFINKYMPQLNEYLHYRVVDVSTMKELCKRWNAEIYSKAPPKKLVHRSLEDIEESIKELRYYREKFLK